MVRALSLLLLFLFAVSPASALDQSQIKSACYEDCAKEAGSNPEFKACVARAADTADGLLNEKFATLQERAQRRQGHGCQARYAARHADDCAAPMDRVPGLNLRL